MDFNNCSASYSIVQNDKPTVQKFPCPINEHVAFIMSVIMAAQNIQTAGRWSRDCVQVFLEAQR